MSRRTRLILAGGLLLVFVACCLSAWLLMGFLPRDPGAWSAAAQAASTSRLMAFLAFVGFGGGCVPILALIACIAAFVFLMVRAARFDGGSYDE